MFIRNLQKIIKENRWFYIPYFVFFFSGLVLQFTVHQYDISLWVNKLHHPFFDFTLKYVTDLGDGLFAAAVVIMLFLYRRAYTIEAILCFYVPALITQALKRLVFADHLRPSARMKSFTELHYVSGVDMHEYNSFPSGHSTSAFAVFLFLALISKNKNYGLAFLLLAILIGFSRIYLLQHFFEDVLTGSFIGVVCATLIYVIFETRRATLQQSA